MSRTPIETTEQIKEQELIQKIADVLHENFDGCYQCESDYCICEDKKLEIPESIMDSGIESLRKLVEEEVKTRMSNIEIFYGGNIIDDRDMLFHKCSECGIRCNCKGFQCRCCLEVKLAIID